MNTDRNAFRAGLFIVASFILMLAVVIGIKGVGRFLEPVQYRTVEFKLSDDVGGLAQGDQVRIGGAKVGVVRDIQVTDDPSGGQEIVVSFTVPKHYAINKNAVVSIQSTITGVSVLNFSTLGSGEKLADGESLQGHPSPLAALMNAAPQAADVINDVHGVIVPKFTSAVDAYHATADSITGLTTDLRGRVPAVVERYNTLAETARNALQQIAELFGDTKSDFRTTVANLSVASTSVKEKLPGMMDKADAALTKINTAVDSANAAMHDVTLVASNTRDVTAAARSIVADNRGKFDSMIVSLKTTSDNLKNASAEIRRSPWRLLYKPGPGEMANLNLYDSARQFSEGASSMSDAATALRDALKDPNANQAQLQKLVEQLDKSFDGFQDVEQKLWSKVQQ